MRWPWVSRGQLEQMRGRLADLQRRFDDVDAERRWLCERLLGGARPSAQTAPALVSVAGSEEEEEARESESPRAFTTPFDSMSQRFRTEFGGGKRAPEKFRVRV